MYDSRNSWLAESLGFIFRIALSWNKNLRIQFVSEEIIPLIVKPVGYHMPVYPYHYVPSIQFDFPLAPLQAYTYKVAYLIYLIESFFDVHYPYLFSK